MKTPLRFVALLATALATPLVLGACTKTYEHAETAQAEGVMVQPIQVWVAHHKLWLHLNVVNEGQEPILVNRDAIVARLPSGQVVSRAIGGTSLHDAYFIPPGGSHLVYVEFHEQGFDWDTVPRVTIDFTAAITRGSQQIPVQMGVAL